MSENVELTKTRKHFGLLGHKVKRIYVFENLLIAFYENI